MEARGWHVDDFHFEPLSFWDLEFFNEVRNSVAGEFLHDSRTFTVQETIDWFMGCTSGNHYYVIKCFALYDDPIGYFRLSWYRPEEKSIYIGMDLHEDWRGKKLATGLYETFMDELHLQVGIKLFKLEVLKTNERAINLYKKLGFKVTEGEGDDTYDSLYMELDYENRD